MQWSAARSLSSAISSAGEGVTYPRGQRGTSSTGAPPTNGSWTADARAHVFDLIEGVRRELTTLVEERTKQQVSESRERDRRYTERSAQQDKAVVDALAGAEKAASAALAAVDKAALVEQANAEKWRNSANEWRQAMNDRESRFLSKEEAALMVAALQSRTAKLEATDSKAVGRTEGHADDRLDRGARMQLAGLVLLSVSIIVATMIGVFH